MSEMPWSLWTFTGRELTPYAEFDFNMLAERYKPGTRLRSKFAQPRSLQHHRLYWAVLHEIVEATGLWLTDDDLHEAVKLHMRMVREVRMLHGEVRFSTRSIEFEKMDQGAFNHFFKRAMLAVEETTGINTDELIAIAKAKSRYEDRADLLREIA